VPVKAHDDELIMSLVEMAIASPRPDREQYLQELCADDPALLHLVRNYVEWERRMDGFLSEPLYPRRFLQHPFEAGQLLHGRFRIIREVAQGGMGIVYEALDEKLDRRIALKCAKAVFRKRLPPEVRNASDISHPNVCKTFEIHTASTDHGDVDFLTMEFLDGETLADRLCRGPFTEVDARSVALQLCAGLSEAHRKQVIHGDLKSNNIILTVDGEAIRAVITDFGLARRPDSATRALQSSQMAGTPDYMAPELWKGAKPSAASDIYALGVILHELLPGRRWSRVIRCCLDPDPARRFKTAAEVANAIAPQSRRWFMASAAAAILAVISGAASYRTATGPKETVRLAMLPFTPAPGDLSLKVADRMSRLKGSPRTKLTLIPLSEMLRQRVDTVEKARTLLGATHLLHGTIEEKDGRIFVHAYLTDTRLRIAAKEWKVDYGTGEVRYLPIALAGMVTGALHLPALNEVAAVNAAASQEYRSGITLMRRETGTDAAIVSMQKAVAADPDSPLTHAGLAEAWWWKYVLTKEQKYLTLSKESAKQAERRNPDLGPVHSIAGLLLANAGLYEQATNEYRRSIELDPDNSDGHRRLGSAYENNNQLDQALVEYRRAIELDPRYYRNYTAIGNYYNQRSDYSEAVKHFEKAVELAPDQPAAHFALATAYLDSGQFTDAERELQRSLLLGETPQALHTLGVVLMYRGKDQDAVTYIKQALDRWPQKYLWWLNLGVAYRRLGLPGESERANRRGLALAESELIQNPRSSVLRASIAYLCARLGDKRRAELEVAQALHSAADDSDTSWMAINTFEALGRRDDALGLLKTAPYAVTADTSRFPDLADLARDPRFLEIWNLKRDR
jgi:tetratricopeptide (TPR) repeat protein